MFDSYSRGVALTAAHIKFEANAEKLAPAVNGLKLDRDSQHFINTILAARYVVGKQVLSNPYVRRVAQDALVTALIDFDKAHPHKEVYFATFAWDEGFTWERQPRVDLTALQRRVDKAVRRAGWEGIFIFEVDGFRPITGESDKRLCFHVHGLCFRGPQGVGIAAFRQRLRNSRSFPNNLLAQAVKLKRAKTVSDYTRIGVYMLKPSACEKNLVPSRNYPGTYRMRETRAGFRPSSALRLAELWSHITARDVLFSVGPVAGKIAADYRKALRQAEMGSHRRGLSVELPADIDIDAEWRKVRRDNGSARLGPVRIVTPSNKARITQMRPDR